jgi:hypothetical protein
MREPVEALEVRRFPDTISKSVKAKRREMVLDRVDLFGKLLEDRPTEMIRGQTVEH